MANPYRLDRTVDPEFYDLAIEPDLSAFTFSGRETITIRIRRGVARITLHAVELKILTAAVRCGRATVPARRITYHPAMETATLHFGRRLPAGTARLDLAFTGRINDKLHGFYRTSYTVRGAKRWGAATQFEATDARRAFPCWDEPDRKARFQLTLRVPKHLTALSNMPAARQRLVGRALRQITYQPTARMSTYLLAWVIAELDRVQRRDRRGVLIRVWTTPGKTAQARFALDVGCHALPYFARWFGIPYALPKLDMVSLPDFASGAMENWGLVTYRETALLVDPRHSSAQTRRRVAEVIAHELAHQWFGNLVTMAWWTDLWLNEGFASYMGPKAVDDRFPQWQIWRQYVAREYLGAMHEDSLRHSHPIEIPVRNPHEIREIFDSITYSKGSSVNRMLEHYLTEPVFRRGLARYLKRYAYRNATTTDLWAVLEEVSGKPVKAIMASYTKQAGYPVLTAAPAGRGVVVRQSRFLADGGTDRRRARWNVPLVTASESRRALSYDLLRGAHATLRVPAAGWIKLNAGQSGFYRTAYAPPLLARLARAIKANRLPALDMLGLLDDAFALAQAGTLPTPQALDLLAACAASKAVDYHVWLTIAGSLGAVERLLADDESRARFSAMARRVLQPAAARLGWVRRPSDGHLDALLRALLLGRLGHYRDAAAIAQARERFARFVRGGELPPDLRGAVYAIVAEHGEAADYEQLLRIYRKAEMQEERVRVLRALTFIQPPALIRRSLAFALSRAVRAQDAYMLLGGFGHNRAGRAVAWDFVKARWKTLVARYASGGLNLMTRIVEGATSSFTTEAELADVRRFFRTHPVRGAERAMQRALETIQITSRWARRDGAAIRRWL